jgi:ribonuclease D
MKIQKFQGDISSEVASSFKDSIAIDTEATGLLIPERDKLSLVQICADGGEVYIIQPDRTNYKMPNLISVLEDSKMQNE